MDTLDRDLIRAEVDANANRPDTLSHIATYGPDIERDWAHDESRPHRTTTHGDLTNISTVCIINAAVAASADNYRSTPLIGHNAHVWDSTPSSWTELVGKEPSIRKPWGDLQVQDEDQQLPSERSRHWEQGSHCLRQTIGRNSW